MKKFILSLSSVFLLSACNLIPTSSEPSVVIPKNTTSSDQMMDSSSSDLSDSMPEEAVFVDYTLEEETLKDMKCDMLSDKKMREDCLSSVNRTIADFLYSDIVNTFDINRCDKLNSYNIESCKNFIKNSGVKGPISLDAYEAFKNATTMIFEQGECKEECDDDNVCISLECTEGRSYYDINKCDALSAPGLSAYCRKIVNQRMDEEKVMQVVESGKSSECNQFSDSSLKNQCNSYFGIFPEEDDFLIQEEPVMEEDIME